jgi:hypothetical protein
MRRLIVLSPLLLGSLLAGAPPALAAPVHRDEFRYQRGLAPASPRGPVVFEPDGPLFAHSRGDFADLRVLDARGQQVPWRPAPLPPTAVPRRITALNSGRHGPYAVALLDLGPERSVRDRLALEIPDENFVGRAEVLGSDRRDGPFTRLSATEIYDLRGGAQPARSTVAVLPPTDFRYLMVRAAGVDRIDGATVSGGGEQPPLIARHPRSASREEHGSRTEITLDFGYRNFPIDEVVVEARTARYDRPIEILGSNDGRRFVPVAAAEISGFPGSRPAPIGLNAQYRFLRIVVENGDDSPLAGIRTAAWSQSRALVVQGGRPGPYTLLYGNPAEVAPDYDYARLPAEVLGLDRAFTARLSAEHQNPEYEPPPDTRSFSARHPETIAAALALAALALGGVGLLALRSRS